MTRDKVLATLAEFFRDAFMDDPIGVSEWVAQGEVEDTEEPSIDAFLAALDREFPHK